MKKSFLVLLLVAAMICSFVSCKEDPPAEPHVHTYSNEWSHDDVNHWHNPTCGDTTEVADLGAHIWDDGDSEGS